jgi:hypothetical protein
MKKALAYILWLIFLISTLTTNAFYNYNEYYWESVKAFINSPSKDELDDIVDEATRYCEQVYLEATRRREYTEIEIAICSDIFEIKRQQELDYINYMYKNRGIY